MDFSRRIIVFPCGDVGIQVINIMKNLYSVNPALLIDNRKSKFSSDIHDLSFLNELDCQNYVVILASTNPSIYKDLKNSILGYFSSNKILELDSMKRADECGIHHKTECGKYSFGPLCNHPFVESVGAFCSFAYGTAVVTNHPTELITTAPFIYFNGRQSFDWLDRENYSDYSDRSWYLPGVQPHRVNVKMRKIRIGNDVWLGTNVIITNGAYIGNGVIAAAGAVITRDVPDYAVVGGVPARIIKYRYNPDQITALNKIAWWDWTDDEIRERYDDFYLPVDEFIKKYN